VMVDFHRNADLVASGAKHLGAMKRLQKGLLVKLGFGLDQLVVEPLQNRIFTIRERIVKRLFDRIVAVADRAVDIDNGMADGAGYAGCSAFVLADVEMRIVENRFVKGAAKKGNGVVTAGAPA